jgi:hypothetical protein
MNNIKCTGCGAEITESTKFCGTCGTKTEAAPAPVEPIAPAPVESIAPAPVEPIAPAPVESIAPAPIAPPPMAPPPIAPAPYAAAAAIPGAGGNALDKIKAVKIGNLDIKKLAIIAGVAVIAIIALIVALAMFGPSQYESYKGSILIEQFDDEKILVIPSGRSRVFIEGDLLWYSESLDGRKAAMLVDIDGMGWEYGYTLYHIGSKVEFIADDVRDFQLASSGNGIVYSMYEWDDETAELFLWSGSGAPRKISNDGAIGFPASISPNGKTAAFATDVRGDSNTGAIWHNNKLHDFGRNIPIAISDGAKYIYYIDRNEALFVQRGFNESTSERLSRDVWGVSFNKDMSQIIYTTGTRSFISNKGRAPIGLNGDVREHILPGNTAVFYDSIGVIYGVRSFANTFYQNDSGNIIRINNKLESDRVGSRSVEQVYLANDGKTLTFLRNDSVFRIDGSRAGAEDMRIIDGDVKYFVMTHDGKGVFYITRDNDIFYQRGMGNSANVTYSFEMSWWGSTPNYGTFMLYKGDTLFYVQDDELFSSTGRGRNRVSGLNGDVRTVRTDNFNVFAFTNDAGDRLIYQSSNGRNFTEMR